MSGAAETTVDLPGDVLAAYFDSPEQVVVRRLAGGEINDTFLTEHQASNQRIVLQQLNPIFGEAVVQDSAEVGKLMQADGWAALQTLPTRLGYLAYRSAGGDLWRGTSFISSVPSRDQDPDYQPTISDFGGYGAILGRFHATLAKSDYEPVHSIDHFHDTDHYAGRLAELQHRMPDQASTAMAARLLGAFRNLPALPVGNDQLLHGDPRTNNMLFDAGGQPFTIIDLDTVMKGSVWIDIGDAVRSLAEDALLKRGNALTLEQITAYADEYRLASGSQLDGATFVAATITAMKRIALELAMRYANDIVDDSYFGWDSKSYTSRRDNHLARIATQEQILTMFPDQSSKLTTEEE